jgi:hypothetical protein
MLSRSGLSDRLWLYDTLSRIRRQVGSDIMLWFHKPIGRTLNQRL